MRGAPAHGQELPERIEDPAAVAVLAAILRDSPARPAPSESTSHERNRPHKPESGGDNHVICLRRFFARGT